MAQTNTAQSMDLNSQPDAPFVLPSTQEALQLESIFQRHLQHAKEHPMPSFEYRITLLRQLKSTISQHVEPLCTAVSADFSNRSHYETKFTEIIILIDEIDHTIKHLKQWMNCETRHLPLHLLPGKAKIEYQPLGVVGIISPWNYPILLAISPLIAAIAAGNHVMMKASEYTPNTNNILATIIQAVFNPRTVSFHQGDHLFAEKFSSLPFDHIFFTGSTAIGKQVMRAAANNLTPVTLELGGKSPVIIDRDYPLAKAAQSIAFGKCINAGQTCIAPDYILCMKGQSDQLVSAIKQKTKKMYPQFANNDHYTSIISLKHLDRLKALLKDAEDQGATIIPLADHTEDFSNCRKMPLTLVTQVTSSMKIMQEEIFGPILPIIEVDSLGKAIDTINDKPRPLALYLFSDDKKIQTEVIETTHSGGMCINDTLTQVAVNDLPFGGIGESGMGQYHGRDGFLTFSKEKPIVQRGRFNPTSLLAPPWGNTLHQYLLKWFL